MMFRELSISEQENLMKHIQVCTLCQHEWNEVQAFQSMLKVVANHSPKPEHPIQLLDKTMRSIGQEATVQKTPWLRWLNYSWSRVSLAAISFTLVVSFISEITTESSIPQASVAIKSSGTMSIIDVAKLKKHFIIRASEQDWRDQCYSAALQKADLNCIKEKLESL